MANRYRLTLCVEFGASDDPAARTVVMRNLDALQSVADDLRGVVPSRDNESVPVKVKLQRLHDDAPPCSLVVETL